MSKNKIYIYFLEVKIQKSIKVLYKNWQHNMKDLVRISMPNIIFQQNMHGLQIIMEINATISDHHILITVDIICLMKYYVQFMAKLLKRGHIWLNPT